MLGTSTWGEHRITATEFSSYLRQQKCRQICKIMVFQDIGQEIIRQSSHSDGKRKKRTDGKNRK